MGAPLPSSAAASAPQVDALQHFAERRRLRFAATFAQQCDVIVALIDKVEQRGARGSVSKLRLLTHRLGALARIAGFTTVSQCAGELEQVVGAVAVFDPVLAREMVENLHDAFATDVAHLTPPSGARPSDVEPQSQRILIVDDHAMLRGGLRALLSGGFSGAMFGEANDGASALAELRRRDWDIALIDISMPGRNGLDLLKEVKAGWPRLPVLVLSGHPEDELALRALRGGASGYLTKKSAPDDLVRAVRKILDGGRYVSETLAEQLAIDVAHDAGRPPHHALSDREYDVACRIAIGKTVTEIAEEMSLSVKTISTYRTRILEKLRVRNNAEIVQYALRNQMVS